MRPRSFPKLTKKHKLVKDDHFNEFQGGSIIVSADFQLLVIAIRLEILLRILQSLKGESFAIT